MPTTSIPADVLAAIQKAEDDLAAAAQADTAHAGTLAGLTAAQTTEAAAVAAALTAHQTAGASATAAIDALKAHLGIA